MKRLKLMNLAGIWCLAFSAPVFAQPLLHTIAPPSPSADGHFGASLAGEGDTLLVGEPGAYGGVGRVVIFDSSDWSVVGELVSAAGVAGEGFGGSLAIEGDIAVVGAPSNDDQGNNAGAAYFFRVSTGEQIAKVYAPGGSGLQHFGRTIAIRDGVALLGAYRDYDTGGAVHFYQADQGLYLESLTSSGSAQGGLGASIAIDGMIAYVGAPYSDGWAGSIHMIDLQTRGFVGQILSNDVGDPDDKSPASSMFFGRSLEARNGVLIVGSGHGSGCNGFFSDAAYFYDTSNNAQSFIPGWDCYGGSGIATSSMMSDSITAVAQTWPGVWNGQAHVFSPGSSVIANTLVAPAAENDDLFGDSIIEHNGMMIIGAPRIDSGASDSGEIYAFGLALPCGPADLNTDGALDYFDVSRFVNRWGYPETDLNGDLSWDFFDVSTFIDLFNAGCP
ncbi:MAG: FG-GAP repeat protein [Phycisphaerales bacterium]|nr:FG-GAP repeat protein [Phycisphaerales bacterium]